MRKFFMADYNEAAFMKVLRPQAAPLGKTFDKWITGTSPVWQRVAVVQLTRYLALETGYRQDLEELKASWIRDQTSVFAIVDDILGKDGNERECLIGIATFHTFLMLPPYSRPRPIRNKALGQPLRPAAA